MEPKHLLYLTILILSSSQTVTSLQCYACTDLSCNNDPYKMPCPAGNKCLSVSYTYGNTHFAVKSCTPPAMCSFPPTYVPSGVSYKQTCCDTDLCNSAITNKMSLVSAGVLVLMSLYVSRC
ncbi:lymphocyte antigen 6 complex locus protein G6c [Ranitomeya variabilis]|uniref:lymphocyte antigen 6 complex locus protein G6c n=1 Tax=Ranitomeya variabilis TaxID=490064 RepID=UPI0040567C2D